MLLLYYFGFGLKIHNAYDLGAIFVLVCNEHFQFYVYGEGDHSSHQFAVEILDICIYGNIGPIRKVHDKVEACIMEMDTLFQFPN